MALSKPTLKKYKLIIDKWFTNDFNGREAYKAFFPKSKDSTATTNFSKLQNYPEIQKYIEEKHQEAAKYIQMNHEGVLSELKRWLESDITQTIGLTPLQVKELPIEVKRLINKYKQTNREIHDKDGNVIQIIETIELWFVSKEKAIEMINKHIGFYEMDNKQRRPEIDYNQLDAETLLKLWNARKQD